jgi:hypothetical protein
MVIPILTYRVHGQLNLSMSIKLYFSLANSQILLVSNYFLSLIFSISYLHDTIILLEDGAMASEVLMVLDKTICLCCEVLKKTGCVAVPNGMCKWSKYHFQYCVHPILLVESLAWMAYM